MKPEEEVLVSRAKIYYSDTYDFDIDEPTAFEVFSKGYGGRYDAEFFIMGYGYDRTTEQVKEDRKSSLQRVANDIKKLRKSTQIGSIQDACDKVLLEIKELYNTLISQK